MVEGSVEIDTGSVPMSTPPVQDQNNNDDPNKDEGGDAPENQNDGGENQNQDENGEKKPKFTEKGTKVDPNPQSAVHQELANAKKTLSQYQQILENPKYLTAYAKEMGLTIAEAKEEIKDRKEEVLEDITPDKLQTAGDVAKILNDIKSEFGKNSKEYKDKITELENQIRTLTEGRQVEKVATTISNDITAIRSKWNELDPVLDEEGKPTNPNYNPELEKAIGAMYHKLDFDERTKTYKGNVSIAEIAETVMTAAGLGKKKGSQDAQTVIKERRDGRIITGNKQQEKGNENSNPGSTIASRIAKVMGK